MVQAARRKFHYIYKTTCLVTNRYYYGMHSTDNLEDGYIGSGQRLWRSIQKHGKENHRCEVVEFLESREALRTREREIVNEEMLKDKQCMNLIMGGGAFELTPEQYKARNSKCGRKGGKIRGPLLSSDPEVVRKRVATMKEKNGYATFTGKSHNEETKKKQSESMKGRYDGTNNPSFGKSWFFHEELKQCKKLSIEEVDVHLQQGWKRGRKMKF